MSHDLGARFRDAFAADLAAPPRMTLRHGDIIDSYGSTSVPVRGLDVVTDDYLQQYCAGLSHLDAASWRHYLPAFVDFTERHLGSNSVVVASVIDSLRPPDRDPPRLASLTNSQEALVREFLEVLAFSNESAWQADAAQALEEWWIDEPLYRPKAGDGSAV